ncbi:hypothetical protein COT77_02900 [Candidatus Berkelbacteria bacterium CG10_big_fil_rev_8_21_14_0_10_41_12]|uniref:Gas vesicle protein n=1 Tax=Candidatus Berkelbacteria bacterium CG10_big_fil_rev_8_21_14_0_10_41_12 TaxID=1974513 RepID=A0A2M6WWS4_9BACT|nr:MAG: hypothetical protein COT77_02900 [Candidatus Berkelbacteria bacterium CG10_big_fil_rev_8_21_14_0_10_41_12]
MAGKDFIKGAAIGGTVGIIAGAIAGVLFAPKPGKETREDIKNYLNEIKDKVAKQVSDVSELTREKYAEISHKVVSNYRDLKKISDDQAGEIEQDLDEGYDKVRAALDKEE